MQRAPAQSALPVYHPLTFRRGMVHAARFAPDQQNHHLQRGVEQENVCDYSQRVQESPESHELEPAGADVLAVSASGEMAFSSLHSHPIAQFLYSGTLARVPLVGGAPSEVLENVEWADWSPDGSTLAIVRQNKAATASSSPLARCSTRPMMSIGHLHITPKAGRNRFPLLTIPNWATMAERLP